MAAALEQRWAAQVMNSLTFSYHRVKYDLQFVNNGCPQIDGRTDRQGSGTVAVVWCERADVRNAARPPADNAHTCCLPSRPHDDRHSHYRNYRPVCLISLVLIANRLSTGLNNHAHFRLKPLSSIVQTEYSVFSVSHTSLHSIGISPIRVI